MGDGFRLAGSMKQFLKNLKTLKESDHEFTIWQSFNGKKRIFKGKFHSIEKERDQYHINISTDITNTFEPESFVYLYEENTGALCKGLYCYNVAGTLKITLEDRFYLKEKRSTDRFSFHYTKIHISISDKNGKSFDRIKLKDISETGFCMNIKNSTLRELNHAQGFYLNKIEDIELPEPLLSRIVHITTPKKNMPITKYIQVGVVFENSSEEIASVISILKNSETVSI